ncbi:hypothetical protein D3C72_2539740 [compost metagenome]
MLWFHEYLRHWPLLHNATLMDNGYPVADVLNDMHLVCNQHNGQIILFINIQQ